LSKSGRYNEFGTSSAMPSDVQGGNQVPTAPDYWNIGEVQGSVHMNFIPKSEWKQVVLSPGEACKLRMVYSDCMRCVDIENEPSARLKGHPAVLFKAVGEVIFNNTNTSEVVYKAAGQAQVYTTAPVELFETFDATIRFRYYPGYLSKLNVVSTQANATAGSIQMIAETTYANASTFARINPDGNGIATFGDMANITTTEPVVNEIAGSNFNSEYVGFQ